MKCLWLEGTAVPQRLVIIDKLSVAILTTNYCLVVQTFLTCHDLSHHKVLGIEFSNC